MEKRNRLKHKNDHEIKNIPWSLYVELLKNKMYQEINMPFENILFTMSFCGIAHYGNDYAYIGIINQITEGNAIQLTGHNKDFDSSLQTDATQFYHITFLRDKYKIQRSNMRSMNTLPELYIWKGSDFIKNWIDDPCG